MVVVFQMFWRVRESMNWSCGKVGIRNRLCTWCYRFCLKSIRCHGRRKLESCIWQLLSSSVRRFQKRVTIVANDAIAEVLHCDVADEPELSMFTLQSWGMTW